MPLALSVAALAASCGVWVALAIRSAVRLFSCVSWSGSSTDWSTLPLTASMRTVCSVPSLATTVATHSGPVAVGLADGEALEPLGEELAPVGEALMDALAEVDAEAEAEAEAEADASVSSSDFPGPFRSSSVTLPPLTAPSAVVTALSKVILVEASSFLRFCWSSVSEALGLGEGLVVRSGTARAASEVSVPVDVLPLSWPQPVSRAAVRTTQAAPAARRRWARRNPVFFGRGSYVMPACLTALRLRHVG